MINLKIASQDDVQDYARLLFNEYRDRITSFEQASKLIVDDIYQTFRQDDGAPTFSLVRIFRLCRPDELTADLKSELGRALDVHQDWLALTATIGDEPAWCDRRQSRRHQAVPLGPDMSLMFQTAIRELGFDKGAFKSSDEVSTENSGAFQVKYFHIANAAASPAIPDKNTFVDPYGIQSVIGMGGEFVSDSFYVALFFSRVAINAEDAEIFAGLSAFLSTLLAVGDDSGTIWMN